MLVDGPGCPVAGVYRGPVLPQRLDLELVARDLAPSRAVAKADIQAGSVAVDGVVVQKPAAKVGRSNTITVHRSEPRFVGRGGAKLAAALDEFPIDPADARCLDAGASTGGFTDCLLQRGASSVVAVDVGTAQLHRRLRNDPRVTVREQTDVRSLRPGDIGGPVDLVVADLSFISLRHVLPPLRALVVGDGSILALVKPQFEAGRAPVARGRGVIRDSATWRRALVDVVGAAAGLGLWLRAATVSPITGAFGNVEFMVLLQPADPSSVSNFAGDGCVTEDDGIIEDVVAEAEARVV